ncbi:TPA: hypothetical protein ACF9PM_004403, partial [Escherichia coli]
RITRNTTPNKATCLPPLNSGALPSSPARCNRLVFRALCKPASASAVTGLNREKIHKKNCANSCAFVQFFRWVFMREAQAKKE